ncbi:hypothetical protein ACSSS7_000931 [Eimeria intestinalis]
MGSSISYVVEDSVASTLDHDTGRSHPDANLQDDVSDGHTSARQAQVAAEDSLDLTSHKRTRTMGIEALLMFPKLALADMFLPADAPETAELPCGPRIAAERVRMFRGLDDSSSFSLNAAYYRQVFLRDRLQTAAALEAAAGPSAASWWGGEDAEDTGLEGAARTEERFDFLSLPSLAAMDAGMSLRPSWNELAPHVGAVQGIKKLLRQMEQEMQQINAKLGELRSARRRRGRGKCDSAASEPHDVSEHAAETIGSSARRGATGAGNRRAQTALFYRTHSPSEEFQFEHQESETQLSLFLRGRGRREAEIAQLEAEALELEKDVAVLNRACLELEALLRRVWNAEKLAEDARVKRASFRRLWCHPPDDSQQMKTADRLFTLCHANLKRQLASPNNSSLRSSSACVGLSGGGDRQVDQEQEEGLSFTELLDQLPPKALESLWCSAELRRKERQNYRYFWI